MGVSPPLVTAIGTCRDEPAGTTTSTVGGDTVSDSGHTSPGVTTQVAATTPVDHNRERRPNVRTYEPPMVVKVTVELIACDGVLGGTLKPTSTASALPLTGKGTGEASSA